MEKKINDIKQLKIQMNSDMKEWLEKQASAKGISDEELINNIFKDYMQKDKENNYVINNETDYHGENEDYKGIANELLEIIRKF